MADTALVNTLYAQLQKRGLKIEDISTEQKECTEVLKELGFASALRRARLRALINRREGNGASGSTQLVPPRTLSLVDADAFGMWSPEANQLKQKCSSFVDESPSPKKNTTHKGRQLVVSYRGSNW